MGKKVNKRELSEIIGYSERTLTEWQKDKTFPLELDGGRGGSNLYDTVDVIEWHLKRALSGAENETARERKDRLGGDEIELRLAEASGQLIPAEGVEQRLTDAVMAARTEILNGDDKLKTELDILYGIDLDIDLLNEHSRAVLSQLSAYGQDTGQGDSASV